MFFMLIMSITGLNIDIMAINGRGAQSVSSFEDLHLKDVCWFVSGVDFYLSLGRSCDYYSDNFCTSPSACRYDVPLSRRSRICPDCSPDRLVWLLYCGIRWRCGETAPVRREGSQHLRGMPVMSSAAGTCVVWGLPVARRIVLGVIFASVFSFAMIRLWTCVFFVCIFVFVSSLPILFLCPSPLDCMPLCPHSLSLPLMNARSRAGFGCPSRACCGVCVQVCRCARRPLWHLSLRCSVRPSSLCPSLSLSFSLHLCLVHVADCSFSLSLLWFLTHSVCLWRIV